MSNSYLKIGRTLKPHGLNGEIKVLIEPIFEPYFEKMDAFFLELKGQKMPQFVEYIRGGGAMIVKMEELNSREMVSVFANKSLFVYRKAIPLTDEELAAEGELDYDYLIGFEIVDEELGSIAKVERIEEYPQQMMAIIKQGERDVLIPLNPAFIIKEDKEQKQIQMRLPEGLLELYGDEKNDENEEE